MSYTVKEEDLKSMVDQSRQALSSSSKRMDDSLMDVLKPIDHQQPPDGEMDPPRALPAVAETFPAEEATKSPAEAELSSPPFLKVGGYTYLLEFNIYIFCVWYT